VVRYKVRFLFIIVAALGCVGCHSFDVPADFRQLRVSRIDRVSFVGFDRLPDLSDASTRQSLVETFNARLESNGGRSTSKPDYSVVFTNICFVFEAQHFTLNQFNLLSPDAYLFARDVEFGCLYRFRIMQGDQELVPETEFFHISDRLTYFERSSGLWWPITFTLFPYYDYYYYDGESVAKSLSSRVLEHLLTKSLPLILERQDNFSPLINSDEGVR
jgi:hypothetical protein